MNADREVEDRVLVEGSAEEFAASRRAVEAWQRQHPVSFADLLAWIDALRRVFGDPPVDRRPSAGDDYRI
jgi:hypothetical protein